MFHSLVSMERDSNGTTINHQFAKPPTHLPVVHHPVIGYPLDTSTLEQSLLKNV